MKFVRTFLLSGTLICSSGVLWAQYSSQPSARDNSQTSTAPDNTRRNQRDRNTHESTADQQKEQTTDRELTRQIRRAVVKDKSLSTYAHNVKIISQNGVVTLKGPVKTEDEKQAIESKAVQVAGAPDKVHNELEVKDASSKPSPQRP